uniref:Uncharacterized protein n=1 Tax=Anguilla anguilla TaxID=7936 RepID=A0A0E9RXC3_ANGAN
MGTSQGAIFPLRGILHMSHAYKCPYTL